MVLEQLEKLNALRTATGRPAVVLKKEKGNLVWNGKTIKNATELYLEADGERISFRQRYYGDMLVQLFDITQIEQFQVVSGNLQVYNWRQFALFAYTQHYSHKFTYKLGDVVLKTGDREKTPENPLGCSIGVVIQTHEDGDFRTDMFGNTSDVEVHPATREDVALYRPDLLIELKK